jgi:hypothetical protein
MAANRGRHPVKGAQPALPHAKQHAPSIGDYQTRTLSLPVFTGCLPAATLAITPARDNKDASCGYRREKIHTRAGQERRAGAPRHAGGGQDQGAAVEPFAYLSILTSIVLGLGVTRVLTGVGRLLQVRHHTPLYWVHLVWAGNLFLFLVLNWWILFRWHSQAEWTFFLFLFVLLSPTIAFLLAVLLFPEPLEDGLNLKHYFYANHRWFFILAALLAPIDGIDTLLKGWDHFLAQGPIYILTLVLVLGLSAVAAMTRNERYHAGFALFFLAYLLTFITINLRVLG